MDFSLTSEQEAIREAVGQICSQFDDAYWLKRDREGGFPQDFMMRWRKRAGLASVRRKPRAAPASASPRQQS